MTEVEIKLEDNKAKVEVNDNIVYISKGKDDYKLDCKDNKLCLHEQSEYHVEFQEDPGDEFKFSKQVFKWFGREKKAGILNYKNFVGTSKFYGVELDIENKKISADEFKELLEEISTIIKALPYDYNSPTFLPFDRTEYWPIEVLYHNFVYLRYIMLQVKNFDRLKGQVNKILYSPHFKREKKIELKDVSKASNINVTTIEKIFTNPENLVKIEPESSLAVTSLAQKIRDISAKKEYFFPERIFVEETIKDYDTPENRFVKYFLNACQDVIKRFQELLKNETELLDAEIEYDCHLMLGQIKTLLSNNFFQEIGDLTFIPSSSSVLQRKEGYREILMHFSRLNLATNYPINEDDLRSIIDSKDIATLYEYWTYFKMVEILRKILGPPKKARIDRTTEKRVELRYYNKIVWDKSKKFPKIELYYNKTYFGKDCKKSYSLPLRPDISLELEGKKYIFDAKFKIDKVDFPEKVNDEIETEEKTSSTFKRGDIYKMHTYKDAINQAISVCLLYPGDTENFRFYEKKDNGDSERTSVDSIEGFDGVGAIPLKPLNHEDLKTLDEFLVRILEKHSEK
ncbi:MAG: DUF2357 domain-containing protein [Candidatus Hydrothermarchaeales archaeon]